MSIQTSWNLAPNFYTDRNDPKLAQDIAEILPRTEAFAKQFEGKIRTIQTADELAAYYKAHDAYDIFLTKPATYLSYLSSLDTQDTDLIRRQGELGVIFQKIEERLLFASTEFQEIGSERLEQFAKDITLAPYKNAILGLARTIKHLLPEGEERVLTKKSRALSVVASLYEEYTGANEFVVEVEGETKTLTEEEVRTLRHAKNPTTRRAALAALRARYGDKHTQIVLGNTYGGVVKEWVSEVDIRKYNTVMEPRNESEEMENEVVDLLLHEVGNASPLFQRFLRAKAKMLGVERLHNADMFAPVGEIERTYSLEEAFDIHMAAMQGFDAEFAQYSQEMFEQGRVDALPRMGKRGGAFASYSPHVPSFVFLNFTGQLRDVSTISHELGHATHGHLSQCQPGAVYSSPLCLAETASIFNEMLLSEHIKQTLTTAERREYLNETLTDAFSTIFRQVQYVSFERRVHEAFAAGQELTYKELNAIWREEQTKLSGDALEYDVSAEAENGWSMIPHIFHTPFYCYAYAFGHTLTYTLFNQYKTEGTPFIEKYKNLLRAGGSVRPKELLANIGIDITKAEFYQNAFREIDTLLQEFEALAQTRA